MENSFFTFAKPYLKFIDDGKMYRTPFEYLYMVIGVFNLIIPIIILSKAIDNHIFDANAKGIFLFILIWAIIAFASWISFQIWWNRKSKIALTSNIGDEYTATPVFAHFIQTLGEWIGTWIGLVGFSVTLLAYLFLGDNVNSFFSALDLDFLGTSFLSIFFMPLYGYVIIVFFKFVAEQARALTSIANNTKINKKEVSDEA